MEYTLTRTRYTLAETMGELTRMVNGQSEHECHTIERAHGDGLVPEGRYRLTLYVSRKLFDRPIHPTYGCTVLLLHKVPGRAYIEIHPANKASELEGCIGPGLVAKDTHVEQSVAAFLLLLWQVNEATARGEDCYINIRRGDE